MGPCLLRSEATSPPRPTELVPRTMRVDNLLATSAGGGAGRANGSGELSAPLPLTPLCIGLWADHWVPSSSSSGTCEGGGGGGGNDCGGAFACLSLPGSPRPPGPSLRLPCRGLMPDHITIPASPCSAVGDDGVEPAGVPFSVPPAPSPEASRGTCKEPLAAVMDRRPRDLARRTRPVNRRAHSTSKANTPAKANTCIAVREKGAKCP